MRPSPILAEIPGCNPACRACHYKDLPYADQLARKRRWAETQLAEWADRLAPIVPAPEGERLGYRAKSWLRAKAEGGEVSFGMFRAVRGEARWEREFVVWDECPIHVDAIRATTGRLRRALAGRPGRFAEESLFGAWFGVPHLVVIARDDRAEELRGFDWGAILEPPLAQAWFHRTNQVGKSVFGEGPIVRLYGESAPGDPPIRAFRQVARTLVDRARDAAASALVEGKPDLVLDLYCGTGEIALRLPPATGWLGVETSKEAVAHANGLRPDTTAVHAAYLGLVEQRLRDPALRDRVGGRYALHVNPPRPGLGEARERVTELIRERRPSSVVYLSCSASSLARDLRAFEAVGFRVRRLQPYDFFPQTEHFETLAVLG